MALIQSVLIMETVPHRVTCLAGYDSLAKPMAIARVQFKLTITVD